MRLSLYADRQQYLQYETVLLEWDFRNEGGATTRVPPVSNAAFWTVEVADADGSLVTGFPKPFIDLRTPLPGVALKPGESIMGWIFLWDYFPPLPPGRYTVRFRMDASFLKGQGGLWSSTASSAPVPFEIFAGKGEDAAAVSLIQRNFVTPHHGLNLLQFSPTACQAILTRTRSARFHAVANFHLGRWADYP